MAALPTVTEFSRCSLLSGVLARGGQTQERDGFSAWLAGHGLRGQGQVLFHKADLESVSRGSALAVEVRAAIDDTDRRPSSRASSTTSTTPSTAPIRSAPCGGSTGSSGSTR